MTDNQNSNPHNCCMVQQTFARFRQQQGKQIARNFAIAWLGLLLLSTAVFAQSPFPAVEPVAYDDATVDFQQQIRVLQDQIDTLKAVKPANHASVVQTFAPAPKPEPPKFPTARLTGFFQADMIFASQSANNMLSVGNGVIANGDVQDGADFRRARLAAVGKVWDDVNYMVEMDFAFAGRPSFMDVWLDIDDAVGSNSLRVGQFRQPFGMDGQTGVKDMTFLERALPFAFLPFRQIGVMTYGHSEDEQATWAFSGFRFPTDFYGGNVGDNGGYGFATRLTHLLIDSPDEDFLIHSGFGYSFIDPANDMLQYQNQPELFVGEFGGGVPVGVPGNLPPFVNTGAFGADNVHLANVELAMACGSFHTQSEFFYTQVDQKGGPSVHFTGAYAQMGYILTGETRDYNRKNAVFGRVKPTQSVGAEGGLGAWEVATRWSYIDLNDANITGGRMTNLASGLNWYLNPYTKFQFNYIHTFLNRPPFGNSHANLFALRAQIDF